MPAKVTFFHYYYDCFCKFRVLSFFDVSYCFYPLVYYYRYLFSTLSLLFVYYYRYFQTDSLVILTDFLRYSFVLSVLLLLLLRRCLPTFLGRFVIVGVIPFSRVSFSRRFGVYSCFFDVRNQYNPCSCRICVYRFFRRFRK